MNDTHLFQLTLTAGNGNIHDQVAYSVNLIFAEESHYNASMPNFAKVVLWHFTSMIFRVSCKLPYQALNSFHFPIVKAD